MESNSEQIQQLKLLSIEYLQPGHHQPRRYFDPKKIEELADSISQQGLIQPIVVRQLASKQYEIIAGERRWRAAQLAGLQEVLCLIREMSDETAAKQTLIENIQREDLNAIEEGEAFLRLKTEFGMTDKLIGESMSEHKSRPYISNTLRLLKLPKSVRNGIMEGDLSAGHGKVLLGLDSPSAMLSWAGRCVEKGWSVQKLTQEIKLHDGTRSSSAKQAAQPQADVARLERVLSEQLGAAVSIKYAPSGRGELKVSFHSLDELQGVLEKLPFKLEP